MYFTGNDTSTNTSCGGTLSLAKGVTKHFYCDPPIVGRYVSVVAPGTSKVVNMCEVEVYSSRGISNGVTGDYIWIYLMLMLKFYVSERGAGMHHIEIPL